MTFYDYCLQKNKSQKTKTRHYSHRIGEIENYDTIKIQIKLVAVKLMHQRLMKSWDSSMLVEQSLVYKTGSYWGGAEGRWPTVQTMRDTEHWGFYFILFYTFLFK